MHANINTLDVIQLLIDKNVNLECETNDKTRPIHLAYMFQSYDIVNLLIKKKVFLDFKFPKNPLYLNINLKNTSYLNINFEKKGGIRVSDLMWKPTNHILFNKSTCDKIKTFMLIRHVKKWKLHIPRSICYEIIKRFVFDDIHIKNEKSISNDFFQVCTNF